MRFAGKEENKAVGKAVKDGCQRRELPVSAAGVSVFALFVVLVASVSVIPQSRCSEQGEGVLLFEGDFKQGWEENWILEGKADLEAEEDGFLMIRTIRRNGEDPGGNVLWYREPLKGDIKFSFDAYVKDARCMPILFFLASPINGEPFFSSERLESAHYSEYAWDRVMDLFSVGYMRDLRVEHTGREDHRSNFRIMGGDVKDSFRNLAFGPRHPDFEEYWNDRHQFREVMDGWQSASIVSTNRDGCTEIGRTYNFSLVRKGNRIRFKVDGDVIHDVNISQAFFTPAEDGYFGFRNFIHNSEIWIGNIEIRSLER